MTRPSSQVIKSPAGGRPRETIHLRNSRLEVDERDGYLHILAVGSMRDLDDVAECNGHFARLMSERATKRALLDARGQETEPHPEVRAAVWEWFKSDRGFDTVAYVVPESEGMKAARINMTAVAFGMNLRAFTSVVEAHRFLAPKRASTLMPAVRAPVENASRKSTFPPASFPPASFPSASLHEEKRSDASDGRKSVNPRSNRGQ
jgi:hypothetical protein